MPLPPHHTSALATLMHLMDDTSAPADLQAAVETGNDLEVQHEVQHAT